MFRNRRASEPEKKKEFDAPLDELNYLLDYLDTLIQQTMDEYVESIRPPPIGAKSRRSNVLDSLKKLRPRSMAGESNLTPNSAHSASSLNNKEAQTPEKNHSPASEKSFRAVASLLDRRRKSKDARFVPMEAGRVAEFVETIRRVAELVIIGERSHSNSDDTRKAQETMAIFETFFERQGLATLTDIVLGSSFDLLSHPAVLQQLEEAEKDETTDLGETLDNDEVPPPRPIPLEEHTDTLLPPTVIATQAIQSVSILVQNVSRATSLFFILSNNHVNQLIQFPLHLYHAAERRRSDVGATIRKFASPELAELTTHFVTFLKSLAMRINAETLQFFLTYPGGMPTEEVEDIIVIDAHPSAEHLRNSSMDEEDRPLDETEETKTSPVSASSHRPVSIKTVQVNFPLYERALEFCAAHQDSFVRVTAMNICLNTLRLATVIPGGDDGHGENDADIGKSPDGVLHNSKPLPLKERVAIAQYVCTPARVEQLASPIFTKLAQLWGLLEEQFREVESTSLPIKKDNDIDGAPSSSKVARAKEKARRQKVMDAFNDTAYNIQDELLLLDDAMKVGLTSLNEQMIEMMLATFVYPLLLQPLLLYFQRSPIPQQVLFADPLNEHSAGRPIADIDTSASENAMVLAPAKSAFFFLSAAFQFLSNPPLLRLLFTALFHPLAPEVTGETMIRAKADVACLGPNENVEIRIDTGEIVEGMMSNTFDRSTYAFGTITGQKCVSSSSSGKAPMGETSCIFVLAPALAEILQFRGDDAALIARTRQNPYRKAIFQCFSICSQFTGLRPLAVAAVETAVSKFPPKFLSDILFGVDLQKFQEGQPSDEASLAILARVDDRDIGGGTTAGESRLALGEKGTGRVGFDYSYEILSAFRSCIMRASPAANGTWKLDYDVIAARALLCIVRENSEALHEAAKRVDKRCRQAAEFLSDIPHSLERFTGSKISNLLNGLDQQVPREGAKIEGAIMDIIFRGHGDVSNSPSVLNSLLEFKQVHGQEHGYAIEVACASSYSEMCSRCCSFTPLDIDTAEGALRDGMDSAKAWVQLDAFSTMMNALVACGGGTIRNKVKLDSFAVKRDGTAVPIWTSMTGEIIYAPISDHFIDILFGYGNDSDFKDASPGNTVNLVGHIALPCVCEVPPSCASLFSTAGAKIVSQGITWQSLYLVLFGRHIVLAEPDRRASGDGRVVSSCPMERISISKDAADARADTAARRLIVSHHDLAKKPPGLFMFEETPKVQDLGSLVKVKQWRSNLDIWFEDSNAVALAFQKVEKGIGKARIQRGTCIQRYLAQDADSTYPKNISLYK